MARPAALVAALLAVACSTAPAGRTYSYRDGTGSVRLAAGAERDSFELDGGTGRFTRNRRFSFEMKGTRGSLAAETSGAAAPAHLSGPQVVVRLHFMGREFPTQHGGVCTIGLRRAERDGATGSLTCVGLGANAGKGYDVQATFTLHP